MPNIWPHPKRPHLPKFLSGSHKPTSHDQVENQARGEAYKKMVFETASQRYEKECAERALQEQEQEQVRQAQEEREELENEEWDMVNAQGLKAQEARKVKAVRAMRRDKALPSAPYDEGLREKYGIFYD